MKEGEIFPCVECEFFASKKYYLDLHMQLIHNQKIKAISNYNQRREKTYSCDQCDFKSAWQSSLVKHKEGMHEGLIFPCDKCNYTANRKSNLRYHKKSEHVPIKYEDLAFPCDKCNFKTNKIRNLRFHKNSVHEPKEYQCNICDAKFKIKFRLQSHEQ